MQLDISDLKALLCQNKNADDSHWNINGNYFIRTVTMIQAGKLIKVTEKELVLIDAAWIADTGKFGKALESCDFSEVEMFRSSKPVIIGRGALIDAQEIDILPTKTT